MARRRRRGFWTRLFLALLGAAAHHGKQQAKQAAKRAGAAMSDRYGTQVIRQASDEYGGKRKAGTPIPACPVDPAEKQPTPAWAFEAMVGNYHVPFSLVADTSITALDEEEMITWALIAACRQVQSERPIDERWPVTWIAATNEAARDHFGAEGQHLVPGMDRR